MTLSLVALALAALIQTGPSFDCARATTESERAICASPILSQLDRDMSAAYAAARRRIEPGARDALRADQQAFLRLGENTYAFRDQPVMADYPGIGDQMAARTSFLGQIGRPTEAGLVGVWGNLFGTVEVRRLANGRLVAEMSTVDPMAGRWICQVELTGLDNGGRLSGHPAGDPEIALSLTRRSGFIEVTESGADGTRGQPGYCGHNGFVEGRYLPIQVR